MHAQALQGGGGSTERPSQIVCRELLPALRTEPRFSGALGLVDRMETALVLIFWETEEDATRLPPAYFAALLAELGVADPAAYAPKVWEVSARA